MNGGKINFAEMKNVIDAAVERGFVPPEVTLPLMPSMIEADRAQAAVAFLWDEHAGALHRLIGEAALLAPIPETARWPCRCYPIRDVDYY